MPGYCTKTDVYALGLSAQAFVSRARPFDAVDGATATVRLVAHGLDSSDVITFVVTSGGSLPTGVSAFTPYTPIVVSSDLFRVKPVGGSLIASFALTGSGWAVAVDPGRRLDAHIVAAAAEIDENLTAEEPPILVDPVTGLFPQTLVAINARMAARAAVTSLQIENAAYRVAVDRLMAKEASDRKMLDTWLAGRPLNPRPTDQTSVADNGAMAAAYREPVPWTTGTL
jgi:hypothetical protein